MPVGTARASPALTPVIGVAGAAKAPEAVAPPERFRPGEATASSNVPHSAHEGHCPTHFVTRQPQAVQRYSGPFATRGTF